MMPMKLSDLPPPGKERTGWPWTESSPVPPVDDEKLNWPRISIITPSFNQGEYIEETIRSVLLQGYPNLEYIVVDGGSSDNTLEILRKYGQFLRWISEPDNGQTDAINKGLKICTGDILAYLNSDDVYLPGVFFKIAEVFKSDPEIMMVYGDIIHIDKNSNEIERHITGLIDFQKYLMGMFYIPQPTVFFRKDSFTKVGYFDDSLHLAMDYDYWLRILLKNEAKYIPEPLAKARIYADAKSSRFDYEYLNERLYILNKIFKENSNINYDREKLFAYTNFIGGLTYLHNYKLLDGLKSIIRASKKDFHYLFNPHLFWNLLEIFFGKTISLKIKPLLKKFYTKNIDEIIR